MAQSLFITFSYKKLLSDWRIMELAQVSPNHLRSSKIPSSHLGRARFLSISSILTKNCPFLALAKSCAKIAEYAWPRCKGPVGDGAKRVRITAVLKL